MEIYVLGCQLEEGCANDIDVSKKGLNLVVITGEPDLDGGSVEEMIHWYHKN